MHSGKHLCLLFNAGPIFVKLQINPCLSTNLKLYKPQIYKTIIHLWKKHLYLFKKKKKNRFSMQDQFFQSFRLNPCTSTNQKLNKLYICKPIFE